MLRKLHLIVLILVLTTGCSNAQPIRVGYAGQLTGPHSDLGVDGRDGALLAVDEINAAGGINGRPLELLVRDDRGDPEVARQVSGELLDQDVVAIIGHSTSTQTEAVFEAINAAGVVLVSPTASSDQFTGQDDFFFRVTPANSFQARMMARHVYTSGITRVSVIYDRSNFAFSESFWRNFEQEFTRLGGRVSAAISFTSGIDNIRVLIQTLVGTTPSAVLLITSAVDTALLAQALRQLDNHIPLFTSGWAQTSELLVKGGAAVEGIEMISVYHQDYTDSTFAAFEERFNARYRRSISFAAVFNYEAVLVLVEGLKQTEGERGGLRAALRSNMRLAGLQGELRLDAYGDVQRNVYVSVVRDGQFVVIETIPAEGLP
ncbi:MAG: amino acid ABC transporter substrate-binding protein [Candidatus Viridilinea halotolerans]|uniref:Amino acid ABC transporter substrate-binding protein n=1 Tax=Candidatus Viridilinea halotolerans TaxID=2491704 RepID=A0A426TZP6_9CHLR|nr:MAG: amino acid ABC transporter substrate-binding protein [Candidatus Viridilinea halotolerans]